MLKPVVGNDDDNVFSWKVMMMMMICASDINDNDDNISNENEGS